MATSSPDIMFVPWYISPKEPLPDFPADAEFPAYPKVHVWFVLHYYLSFMCFLCVYLLVSLSKTGRCEKERLTKRTFTCRHLIFPSSVATEIFYSPK